MDAFGQGTRFVIISSFEESYLCSLKEDDLNVTDDHEPSAKTSGLQDCTQSPAKYQPIPGAVSFSDSDGTPNSTNSTPPGDSEPDQSFFTPDPDSQRVLHCSRAYKPHELVLLAYTAIKLALASNAQSSRNIYQVGMSGPFSFPRALRVVSGDQEDFGWGSLQGFFGSQIVSQSRSQTRDLRQRPLRGDNESYYIIGRLGEGSTSNTFHALDSEGKEVALKVYVKNQRENGSMLKEEFDEIARIATEREASQLRHFYNFSDREVETIKIFGRHCIVMPVFESALKFVEGEGAPRLLANILKVYEEKFLNNGLKYKEEDIRWRHIGVRQPCNAERQFFLFDLADLEEFDEKNDPDALDDFKGVLEQRLRRAK